MPTGQVSYMVGGGGGRPQVALWWHDDDADDDASGGDFNCIVECIAGLILPLPRRREFSRKVRISEYRSLLNRR